jgi:hypothetical protein
LQDVATYVGDDGTKMSWVDHILSSPSVDNLLSNLCILNDVYISDHEPVSFIIPGAISNRDTHKSEPDNIIACEVSLWNNSDAATL